MAAIPPFTPTFEHQDWIDNLDRVTAGGPNGFNGRFNALQTDLNRIVQTFQAVNDALQTRAIVKSLIDTNVTIPAFTGGTGGTFDVTLGSLLPLTSHVFHQVSVRPDASFLNVQVTWTEIVFVADTGTGPPLLARMLRLQHRNPNAVTASVRVLRLEMPS
ncbi:hypothetical protein IVB30_20170 [Bradyrhizobium sp. 200]|uniref:hypothetical protein n=1 Tax=Bradyrhizobium sp. 200 TaxID=2782665 RepID=UPI001FFFD1E9|nr:hypothetical protein [Bradyrhizobium sp. 200]UPJ53424.1 hypothetical protein IVB30_20170 [Bradyrhizobium sp. 200]